MKKETLFILLGIGGVGAFLIYKNKKKKNAVSPIQASSPEPAVISTRPAVINPIANPIIEDDIIKPRENKGLIGNVVKDPRLIEQIQEEQQKAREKEKERLKRELNPLPPDPMLEPIIKKRPLQVSIERKPIRTSPTYTVPRYTDEEKINESVDVEPFTRPAIPTSNDKIKSDSEVYTTARKMLQVEKGRINFKNKAEQDSYLVRANKSAYPKTQIEKEFKISYN